MKKFFFLAIVATIFSVFSSSETFAQAQTNLINNSNCDVVVAYEYGPEGTCERVGYNLVTIPAGTTISSGLQPGMWIINAKGNFTNGVNNYDCWPFYVSMPGCYPDTDVVDEVICNTTCGFIKGEIDPSFGVRVSHP